MWHLAITLLVGVVACLTLTPGVALGQAGFDWTEKTIPSASADYWRGIVYGNGRFVAVSQNGQYATSPTGTAWTLSSGLMFGASAVAYGNGRFVAVRGGGAGYQVMTSTDGTNWGLVATPSASKGWQAVTFGNGLFVAVAAYSNSGDASQLVMTSPDGLTWTYRTAASQDPWVDVVFGAGIFVAVAKGNASNLVMSSPDGINWTTGSTPRGTPVGWKEWRAVAYGNGRFVAVADYSSGNQKQVAMTSPDGATWTIRELEKFDYDDNRTMWNDIAFGSGVFVAAGSNGIFARSPDGVDWVTAADWRTNGRLETVLGYANNVFIAARYGTSLLTSGTFLLAPDPPGKPTVTFGDAEATIGMSQGAGSGGAPASYTVTSSPDGRTCSVTVPATACTISGLTNGTPYTFTATATNIMGVSGPSVPSDPVTPTAPPPPPPPPPPVPDPPTAPGAPTGTTVASGNESARVEFGGSSGSQGGMRYTVTARPAAHAAVMAVGPARSPLRGLAVDAGGTAYSIAQDGVNVRVTSPDGRNRGVIARGGEPFGIVTGAGGDVYWTTPFKRSITRYRAGGEPGIFVRVGGVPYPIAADAAGNLYTGDTETGAIVKVAPDGRFETIGRTPDEPFAIVIDPAGRVNVLTRGRGSNLSTRRLERLGPGGSRTSYVLSGVPQALAVDSEGNAYLANLEGNPVTRVSLDGSIAPYGPPRFSNPFLRASGVAVGTDGAVYYSAYESRTGLRGESDGEITAIERDGALRRVHSGGDDVPLKLLVNATGDIYWVDGITAQLMRAVPLAPQTCTVVAPPSASGRLGCNLTGLVNGALYDVTVQAVNDVGEGPTSDPARANPQAKLQAFVAEPPVASAGAVTALSAKMALAGSTMSASATPARGGAAATSRNPMLGTPFAKGVTRVRGRCTTRGLTATCRLRLAPGRWRITLTERNTGAVVGQASTVLRVAGARRAAVTG